MRFDGWKEGKVGASRDQISVLALKQSDFKLEAVSPRLKQQLVHPQRTARCRGCSSPLTASGLSRGAIPMAWSRFGKWLPASN